MNVPQTFEIVECAESKIERYLELLQRCETVLTRIMAVKNLENYRISVREGRALLDDLREELGK